MRDSACNILISVYHYENIKSKYFVISKKNKTKFHVLISCLVAAANDALLKNYSWIVQDNNDKTCQFTTKC